VQLRLISHGPTPEVRRRQRSAPKAPSPDAGQENERGGRAGSAGRPEHD